MHELFARKVYSGPLSQVSNKSCFLLSRISPRVRLITHTISHCQRLDIGSFSLYIKNLLGGGSWPGVLGLLMQLTKYLSGHTFLHIFC